MPKRVAASKKARENWDMSQERAFMENLLNKRFHFFLIFYSIVVGGYLNAKDQLQILTILVLGILIAFPLALTISRAGYRLTLIVRELYRNKNHQITLIRDRARGFSVR